MENSAAWNYFNAQAPSYRKTIIFWVMSAKHKATRLSRLSKLIDAFSSGKRLIYSIKMMDDFQVFVKPVGAACNLNCSYCYYLEKVNLYPDAKKFRMSDVLLEKYIIQHIQASSAQTIFFSWHGGEPTLAGLEYFRRIVEFQKKHLPDKRSILNGIQTNGTLLNDEWCRFLKTENFVVGISLDGPEEFHSVNRLRSNRLSCFDEVIRGFYLLKTYEIPCEILCVVHAQNVGFPLEVYRFFKILKAECITFLPLVEKQTSGGKAVSERTVPAKSFGTFLCTIFDEWKTADLGTVKIQIFEEALRTAFGTEHSLCIFKPVCGRVPVIERNGDFFSCDHFVNAENRVGNIRQTSLSEMLKSPQQKAFGQAKHGTLPDFCLKCEVREMCNGACPKDRFINTPEGEPGLNYLCEGYKSFFNHCKPFVEEVARVWTMQQS